MRIVTPLARRVGGVTSRQSMARPRSRALLVVGMLLAVVLWSPHGAAAPSPVAPLSSPSRPVTWSGTLTVPDPMGCGAVASAGCDVTRVAVSARRGTWITVSVDVATAYLRVEHQGAYVADGGEHVSGGQPTAAPTVTFQHVRDGRTTYEVGVSHVTASPATPVRYRGTARLAGRAFDREGRCGLTTGTTHLLSDEAATLLELRVRLVADPKDRAAVLTAGRQLAATYARISVRLRLSYDFTALRKPSAGKQWYDQVRARYGGSRPRGVDVVHVMTDGWAGGFADCIGGIAYPERAFSVGSIRFTSQGVVPVPGQPQAPASLVAAHEIGHLLGAEHQQVSCVEALPQLAAQPPESGWIRPCTVMGPVAQLDSEVFSTLERRTIRAFVRAYGTAPLPG